MCTEGSSWHYLSQPGEKKKRKTVDCLNGMGESLQLLHILLTDCGAVFLMMLRIMAWKMLLAKNSVRKGYKIIADILVS